MPRRSKADVELGEQCRDLRVLIFQEPDRLVACRHPGIVAGGTIGPKQGSPGHRAERPADTILRRRPLEPEPVQTGGGSTRGERHATHRADPRARDAAPGLRPIPVAERRLGGLDAAILWFDLSIGLLVMVTGALLVPALGPPQALLAIAVGSLIGCVPLALVALAGQREGVPTMVCSGRSWGSVARSSRR